MYGSVAGRFTYSGVLVAIALAGGLGAFAQTRELPPDLTLADRPVAPDAFRIPRERLSNQESHPFLFLGEVMDETHPQWDRYGPSIDRYPDVRGCLAPKEQGAPEPNLPHIASGDVRRASDLEVCLFRIFASLGQPERTVDLMRYRDLSTSGLRRTYPEGHTRLADRSTKRISGSWIPEQSIERQPTLLWRLFGFSIACSYSFSAQFTEDERLAGVHVGSSTK